MCGVAGWIKTDGSPVDQQILKKMNDQISSRGPDDEGYYVDRFVGLAHRRLSIIDLSGGHQPITSDDGRYTIILNGEIYNFKDLKTELENEGAVFHTHSDTEVLLKIFEKQGADCLQKLNGMFAFAVWDKQKEELFIARDRMGKKPLYYGLFGSDFVFASEIKALLKHPAVAKELNQEALAHFFTYEYIPAPLSIIKGIKKLPQAHFLTLKNGQISTNRYWEPPLDKRFEGDEKEASKELLKQLDDAVMARLVSDVPLGVFLSGGLDSSTVVALLAKHKAGKDIKTFSINFKEASYDESLYSSTVAKKFGTDHHEQVLTASVMLDILPHVTKYMDEPFADGSILPTYLLSHFTRQSVTVALGGDGADELFAGYPTFFASRVANAYRKFPSVFKKATHGMVNLLPTSDKNMSLDFKARQFLAGADHEGVLKNQFWLAAITPNHHQDLFSDAFLQNNPGLDTLDLIKKEMQHCPNKNANEELLYFYQKFYMCDGILTIVDRASMANSLEVRAPFLDVNVVNFVSTLPYHYKLKGVTTKYLLKKTVNRMLPAMITQRSKKGFGIPIAGWLKNELRHTLLSTLSKERIDKDGLFKWDYINQLVQEHLNGKRNNRKPLFALLMYHLWADEYLA